MFRWFKKTSWIVKMLVLGFVVVFGVVIFNRINSKKDDTYVFDMVSPRDVTEVVSESGNITTPGKTDVKSPTNGVIDELFVKNGDIVGVDQELFTVVSTASEDEKATAYANLKAAQSALNTAEQTKRTLEVTLEQKREAVLDARTDVHERNDRLIQDSENPDTGEEYTEAEIKSIESALTSAIQDFNVTEKKYVEADVAIEAARADLKNYTIQYESTKSRTVTSPTIGTVSNLSVSVGDTVRVETLTHIPVPVLSIANFSSNVVVIDVNESDIYKLHVGQEALVDPEALDGTFQGVIMRIDDIGTTSGSGSVVDYTVYLELADVDTRLRSGMTVDVDIVTTKLESVLSVPNPAVKPYQGGRAVRVLDDAGEIQFVPVEIGVKGESYTQILDGIDEGQQIVVSLSSESKQKTNPFGF
jgi:HlyD family secretion protein